MKALAAIIGIGITKFGEHWNKGIKELLAEAQLKALEDAGISEKDIQQIYVANMCADSLSGQLHLGSIASQILGINVPSYRVEAACASGGVAINAAINALRHKDIVLVSGVEKMTDVDTAKVTTALMGAGNEEWEEFHGATFPALYALMANAYMHEFSIAEEKFREILSKIAVKNHKHASKNPFAQFPREITLQQANNASIVTYPLRLFDCSPISDGAAALVLCKPELAKKFCDSPVYVVASAVATDTLALAERESLTSLKATRLAAKDALNQAGISIKDINVFEVHDCFTIAELIAMEDLGIAERGKASKLIEEEQTYYDASIPINPSGGLKAFGHAVGATGIKQAVELTKQLRNEAYCQVENAEFALSHNVGGSGGTAAVHIYARRLL